MENIKKEALSWNDAWAREGSQSWYPDEQVVRFLAGNFVRRAGVGGIDLAFKHPDMPLKGVDLGCGNGRHMVTMRQHGIEAHGSDLSLVGVECANKWLAQLDFPQTGKMASLTELPYEDESFHLGLCHGVLDHMLADTRRASIREIHRVLAPSSTLFVSLISESDSTFGHGEPLEANTWAVPDGYEKGLPQAFFTKDSAVAEMVGFTVQSIVEVRHETLLGRSLIGSDKHYACDARFYLILEKNVEPAS